MGETATFGQGFNLTTLGILTRPTRFNMTLNISTDAARISSSSPMTSHASASLAGSTERNYITSEPPSSPEYPTYVHVYNQTLWEMLYAFPNSTVFELNATEELNPGSPQFELRPHSMTHLLVTSIILGTMILATIIGNCFVIAAVLLERNLHSVSNYLIVSLAVADLMVAALVMPLAAVNEVSSEWFLGSEMCDFFISMDVLCCTASILHLVCIAMDRYWAVTIVDYIRTRTATRIIVMIVLTWVASAGISIPPLFGWKEPGFDASSTGMCLISQDVGYTVFSTLGAFYLPLAVMIIIYIKIYHTAKNRIRKKQFGGRAKKTVANSTSNSPAQTDGTALTQVPSSVSDSPERSSNGVVNDNNRNHKPVVATENHLSVEGSPVVKKPRKHHHHHQSNHQRNGVDHSKYTTTPLHPHQEVKETLLVPKQISRNRAPSNRDRNKEKLEHKRERKAARTLAIITGTFIGCWLPFFIVAVIGPLCGDHCHIPDVFISFILWLGYFNSLLNPIIYTIFSPDFRNAFRKILFGKYRNQYRRGR